MSFHLKRPKRDDQEDDLLKFQEEFLRNKGSEQPAAKVIKNPKMSENLQDTEKNEDKSQKMEIDIEADDQSLIAVLSTIKEKPLLTHEEFNSKFNSSSLNSNVLKIEKIDFKELSKKSNEKTKSLFAQNLERQGKLKSHFQLTNIHQPINLIENEKIKLIEKQILNKKTEIKQIITGDGLGNKKDVDQIHLENLELLSKMKEEEILQEQERLIQQLDPKIISFIKRRAAQAAEQQDNINSLNKPNKLSEEEILEEMPVKPKKNWLNMNKIEYDKLEWMIKPRKNIENLSEKNSSARFDFEGNLITPKEGLEIPVTKALHHHGNEPDLAGYTLDELFHLARSKFNQQRVLALQTLSNIVNKCHLGYYADKIKSGKLKNIDGEEKEMIDDDDEESENDKHNLLNQLIEGGILFLARCSLDDQTESIINVSLILIKNILQPFEQESILDYDYDLYRGFEMVCLHPFSKIFIDENMIASYRNNQSKFNLDKNLNVNERKDLSELKDDEYIQVDLVGGLFRMNINERFFYLLDRYKPSLTSNTIIHSIFMILFRCLRHSSQICIDFSEKYSHLLDVMIKNFLPSFIQQLNLEKEEDKYVIINATYTLKLIRLVACAGPNIAFKLFKKYVLNQILINYLTIDKYLNGNHIEIVKLQTEVIRLFKLYSIYDHTQETNLVEDIIIDGYEIFIKHLTNLIHKIKTESSNNNNHEACVIYLQSFLSLFDILMSNLKEDDSILKHEICSSTFNTILAFTLNQFEGYFNRRTEKEINFDMNLMSCCFNVLLNYLEILDTSAKAKKSESLEIKLNIIENLIEKILMPILNENEKINRLKFEQLVLNKLMINQESVNESYKKIYNNNLSYLPTIVNIDSYGVKNGPFCFLSSFIRLYSLCFKLRFKLIEKNQKSFNLTSNFLFNNPSFKAYFKSYCNTNGSSQSNESIYNSYLITKYENIFIYNYLKFSYTFFNFQDNNENSNEAFAETKYNLYLLALNLMTRLKTGDECVIYDIIASFLLNVNIWSLYLSNNEKSSFTTEKNFLINYFSQMSLEESQIEFSYLNVSLNQSETIKINKNILCNLESSHIYESLNQMKFIYLDYNYLISNSSLEHSTKLNNLYSNSSIHSFKSKNNSIKNLFATNYYSNRFALPFDWIYLPIINEFKKQEKKNFQSNQNNEERQGSNESIKIIKSLSNSLKYIYLLENYYNDYLSSNINYTLRYIRMLYVYLFESEVFLDKQIVTYLYLIFFKYAKDSKKPLENLKFDQKIDGIMSFYDFYQYLLQHYDSTSFGDYLFSLYLIVPLQQKYNPKYRQLFWSDFSHLFKFIKFNSQHSKLLIPYNNFVKPNERSLHLIRLYSQILLDPVDFQMISQSKLGYGIIIAHLNSFIFEHTVNSESNRIEFEFKKLLLTKITSLNNQKLKHDLINFKCFNKNDEFELYEDLPDIRKQWLIKLSN